ncbi:MAG: 3-deoxy-manno-octulosonate cytidylyltransferase [bacterium]|nr:3-deoxy-manno-octulosonate cytidylyltransferase [bacterium]
MTIIAVIPARMESSRFPGKPLKPILGMPMLGHVYFRTRMSSVLDAVYLATCNSEIAAYGEHIGAPVVMTKSTHERATDRTAEAIERIEQETGTRADIVVMVQGDEPMVTPEMIDAAVQPMVNDPSIPVVNLMAPLADGREHDDYNEPKVVVDRRSNALYFSREASPSRWKMGTDVPMQKQVCIMPFRRDFLRTFAQLPPTVLEIAESIDMLRALEHGYAVRMVVSPTPGTYSVDTPEDLARVERCMGQDPLLPRYHRAVKE